MKPLPGLDVSVVDPKTGLMSQTWYEYFQSRTAGNYLESSILIGSAVSLTSGISKTITNLVLPNGDWDVEGNIYINPAATTSITKYQASLSLVTDTIDTTPGRFFGITIPATVSGGFVFSAPIPSSKFTGGVTLFLVAQATFTVSTCSAYGVIRARRLD